MVVHDERMKTRPYGRIVFTLAFSFFVICATNQCSGFVFAEMWKLIAVLAFSLLIFFVVKYTPKLAELVAVSVVELAKELLGLAMRHEAVRNSWEPSRVPDVLLISLSFQRPPPFLSI